MPGIVSTEASAIMTLTTFPLLSITQHRVSPGALPAASVTALVTAVFHAAVLT